MTDSSAGPGLHLESPGAGAGGRWQAWPEAGLEGVDLGLAARTDGALSAQRIRAIGGERGLGEWHCYDLDLEVLLVVGGHLRLENERGEVHSLGPGSVFSQPAFFWHRDLARSSDLDVVYLTSPAQPRLYEGRASALPARAADLPSDRAGRYTHEDEGAWGPAPGPRRTMQVRSVQLAPGSRRGVHLQIVRPDASGAHDVWPSTTALRWLHVLSGETRVTLQDRSQAQLVAGACLTLVPGESAEAEFGPHSGDHSAFELVLFLPREAAKAE